MATPGPAEVPAEILIAGAVPLIHHRSDEMLQLLQPINAALRTLFCTARDVYMLPGSGTAGMECALVNCFRRGDKIVVVDNGYFGARFCEIAAALGLEVVAVKVEWGRAVDVAELTKVLKSTPDVKGCCVVHSETSTGVVNDIQQIGALCRELGILTIVDAISSLVAHRLEMDRWGLDVVIAASHKAFMMPPGLVFVAVSERAWRAIDANTPASFYFSLKRSREFYPFSSTSPAVSLIFCLRQAIDRLLSVPLEEHARRYHTMARSVAAGFEALGFENVVRNPAERCNVITIVRPPANVSAEPLLKLLQTRMNLTLTGGQGPFKGRVVRFGHVGSMDLIDVHGFFGAIENTLRALEAKVPFGASSAAINSTYSHAQAVPA